MRSSIRKNELNPSLSRCAFIRLYGPIIPTLVWYGMWVFSIVKYWPYVIKDWTLEIVVITIIACVILLFFPIWMFKPYRLFTDSSWTGIILDKKLKYYDLPDKGTSVEARFDREKVIVSAVAENGKTKSFTFRDELVTNADYYKKGDPVRHHKGLTYYEKLDKSGDSTVICLNCGRVCDMDKSSCLGCGLKLQK